MTWAWMLATSIAFAQPGTDTAKDSENTQPEVAYAPKKAPKGPYVFGWMNYGSELNVRGGTTVGVPVTLETEPSKEWTDIQQTGLDTQEKDRRAILALAGGYRISFDFLEVETYGPTAAPSTPYRSWATERVDVLENSENFISLQHTIVMFMVMEDGSSSDAMLVKHWRQDWEYEPKTALEFIGNNRWETRKLGKDERSGNWQQTVYQVDDSPRYTMRGAWEHNANFSAWHGESSWRPLPRREHTIRDDYQTLVGTNRITVHPTGWVHTQDNIKTVLSEPKIIDAENPAVARELGVNRYDRISEFDFSKADEYWKETGDFWAQTRAAWSDYLSRSETVKVDTHCDGVRVYQKLFELASTFGKEENAAADKRQKDIDKVLSCAVSSVE